MVSRSSSTTGKHTEFVGTEVWTRAGTDASCLFRICSYGGAGYQASWGAALEAKKVNMQ
jgi:hypothetical protein